MRATAKAVNEAINTDAAPRSLIFPAFLVLLVEYKSTRSSMAVLMISVQNTRPMQKHIIVHSSMVIFKKIPAAIAANAEIE